jgi:hypothetical protein
VLHLRDFYQADFAAELITLLPGWVCWLGERNGAAPHLTERCRPYALGKPYRTSAPTKHAETTGPA